MSNLENTKLIEEAHHLMDYWAGTVWEKIIGADLEANDLEMLHEHIKDARNQMFDNEYTLDPPEETEDPHKPSNWSLNDRHIF